MPLTLRPADADDLPALAKLMNEAYRGTGPDASWNTEAPYLEGDRTSETALKDELAAKPGSFLLIAEEDAQPPIGGCVWLEPVAAAAWYLGSLTVDPTLQKSGLGRSLLASAEEWAKERGARTIEMHVINLRDTLIAWYERRGYHLTGEPTRSHTGTTASELPCAMTWLSSYWRSNSDFAGVHRTQGE